VRSRKRARLLVELMSDVLTFDDVCNLCVVLVAGGQCYVKSDAAIRVASYLRGSWKLLGAVRILPRPIRDWGYDVVARNRYRLFGRAESCMVPTPELRARFIRE
jgi:predicted DCC family thiol-disulfide oxidoreductase YuxK